MTKRSELIRKNIGSLIYEQGLFQNAGNDEAVERTQAKIEILRSQLLSVEEQEKLIKDEIEDQG